MRCAAERGDFGTGSAGDTVGVTVALRNRWFTLLPWDLAYGSMSATATIEPLDPTLQQVSPSY